LKRQWFTRLYVFSVSVIAFGMDYLAVLLRRRRRFARWRVYKKLSPRNQCLLFLSRAQPRKDSLGRHLYPHRRLSPRPTPLRPRAPKQPLCCTTRLARFGRSDEHVDNPCRQLVCGHSFAVTVDAPQMMSLIGVADGKTMFNAKMRGT
jgi:hypothetical protein